MALCSLISFAKDDKYSVIDDMLCFNCLIFKGDDSVSAVFGKRIIELRRNVVVMFTLECIFCSIAVSSVNI